MTLKLKYLNNTYQDLSNDILTLPACVSKIGKILHRGRNKIFQVNINGNDFVVKCYKPANFFQKIAYSFFKPSKSSRAFSYAKKLGDLSISTPLPVASMEIYKTIFFKRDYFVSLVDNRPNAEILYTDYDQDLVKAIASFFVEIHEKGFLHGDLNLSNLLWIKEGDKYQFSLIDTNRSQFLAKPASRRQILINLSRVTHVRSILRDIAREYAILKKWDSELFASDLIKTVEHFELRQNIKALLLGRGLRYKDMENAKR